MYSPTSSGSRSHTGSRWNVLLARRLTQRHIAAAAATVLVILTLYYVMLPGHGHYSRLDQDVLVSDAPSPPSPLWMHRAEQVKQAFVHAYHGYETYASPHDELLPRTNASKDNFNGWGVTVFDSLDTMLLMGLDDEFSRALPIVEKAEFSIKPLILSEGNERERFAPFFETTIRYLGGLLSAYAMSREPMLLKRADELGMLLSPVFNTSSGLPLFGVNTMNGHLSGGLFGVLAEIASCQMEYAYLAHVTGKKEHFDKADKIRKTLANADVRRIGDMFPQRFNLSSGQPANELLSMGAAADSAHEYLLKMYLLTARTDKDYLQMYLRTINHVLTHMVYISNSRELIYVTDTSYPTYVPSHRFEHLSCFFPGLLALGAHTLDFTLDDLDVSTLGPDGQASYELLKNYDLRTLHMWAADGIATSCYLMYADQASGLGPDEVTMSPKPKLEKDKRAGYVGRPKGGATAPKASRWIDELERWRKSGSKGVPPGLGNKPPIKPEPGVPSSEQKERDYKVRRTDYFLRPETLESIYLMWRTTGDPIWRERGWEIFLALERETKTPSGYASVSNVERSPAPLRDDMPSYFLAETLKYLYLLFSEEDLVPLDRWVFNTEAHPFPVFQWESWEKKKFNASS